MCVIDLERLLVDLRLRGYGQCINIRPFKVGRFDPVHDHSENAMTQHSCKDVENY